MNDATASTSAGDPPALSGPAPVRLGFLGLGWIGRHRMEAIAKSGLAEITAIADPVLGMAEQARLHAPGAMRLGALEELMDLGLDGIVIATPSALHAEQSLAALKRGLAVFCQKPLARTGPETREILEEAERRDVLLGVDLSYRHLAGSKALFDLIRQGELGEVYAADLVFHNAYGPDKAWFYDARLSGGGCVIDLGIHLVDLLLWLLDFPPVIRVTSRLFARGKPLPRDPEIVEDYAVARLDLGTGAAVTLACSWNLPAGQDACIEARFFGTQGGATLRNVNGSFYEFTAERFRGTSRETLTAGADDWGGRAAIEWVRRLAAGGRFDPAIRHLRDVADVVDAIYGRGTHRPGLKTGGDGIPDEDLSA